MRLVINSNSLLNRVYNNAPDIFKAIRVKGHYRRLPNGKTIWIQEHNDKRSAAKKDPKKFRGKVVHTDDKSSTYVTHDDEVKTVPHRPHMELSQDDIHAHLNRAMSVDDDLARKVYMTEHGLKSLNDEKDLGLEYLLKKHKVEDVEAFLQELVRDEKKKAKSTGKQPEFKDRSGALAWLGGSLSAGQKNELIEQLRDKSVKGITKDLRQTYGEVTTPAIAATKMGSDGRARLAEHFADAEDHPAMDDAHRTIAHMANRHAEGAMQAVKDEAAAVAKANKAQPEDCPKMDGLSPHIQLFGHQAQTLAALNHLKKGLIDVDMGGGKGLILPADAMNLMSQGKVKKPLIVVPGKTLEQNAQKILEYTKNGMNVFMINNQTISQQFGGDLDKMNEAINDAPPNTIFMSTYDVFSYAAKKRDDDEDDGSPDEDRFERADALGAAGFDYVALDESHNIKNVQSKRFKALQALTHIPYKRIASGTFISNNPKDALGQLLFLHPHLGLTSEKFQEEYGKEDTGGGIKWSYEGTKKLRNDLKQMGMISLRRSAWIDQLPERNEQLAVVKMDGHHERVYDAVLNKTLDLLEESMMKDAKLRKLLESDDGIDTDEELPPNLLGPLNLLQAITDSPHELAESVGEDMAEYKALKKQYENGDLEDDAESSEKYAQMEELRDSLAKMPPSIRKGILSLKGVVSPKAHDVYKRIDEHFANKKNGKYMVFVQRIASAEHIIKNMPLELWTKHAGLNPAEVRKQAKQLLSEEQARVKEHNKGLPKDEHIEPDFDDENGALEKLKSKFVMYFDASKAADLPTFTQDPNGPKVLVAVDQSIKEGMNMQIANGQYRYDHHYSPGNQEQGYARIWRFGQDKPCKIHLGVVDGGIDVTKYARLISKLHTNQLVTSEMEDDDTFSAYKLSLDNLRHHRSANILDEYTGMNKKILDFQVKENKELKKKFGDKKYARGSGKQIGGKKAQQMHGIGPYVSDMNMEKTAMPGDDELDQLLGHFRDAHRKLGRPEAVHDTYFQDEYFPEIIKLWWRHKARGADKPFDEHTIKQYESELDDPLNDNERKLFAQTLKGMASGKKATKHTDVEAADVYDHYAKNWGLPKSKEHKKFILEDVKALLAFAKKNKINMVNLGQDSNDKQLGIETPADFDKYWKEHEKKHGKVSAQGKKLVMGIASLVDELHGGWGKIKRHFENQFDYDWQKGEGGEE